MCWREQSLQSTKFVWNFLLRCFIHCPHLKKCYKTGSHWQTKSPRRQVKEIVWVKLNGDKATATLARAYSLFYKNSGIEITWLSPDIDILIHFCIEIKILVKCNSIMQSRSLATLVGLSIHLKSLSKWCQKECAWSLTLLSSCEPFFLFFVVGARKAAPGTRYCFFWWGL